ncbi:MAG TPA: F0F1 ATP synthase subunit B [Clostridia bacterium]|nr:F0F1 ATP synthase subunit B [Clostridia bacterium]
MLESLNAIKPLFAALNLIVLYIVLKRVLFKPVTEFMEKRTQSIKDSMDDAEKQKAEAMELKRSYEEQIGHAKEDAEKILREARAKAEAEHDRIVEEGHKEVEALTARAREDIEGERRQMISELRAQVAGLALAAASRVIEVNLDTEKNRALVDKFIDEAGAA